MNTDISIITMAVQITIYIDIKCYDMLTRWVETYYMDAILPSGRENVEIHCEYNVLTNEQWGYMFIY